jgi:A/G-specific adenine glycosylase
MDKTELTSVSVRDVSRFRERIVSWFEHYGREYPWRKTKDPFMVLISEMMLRRTKAEQVVQVYERFVRKFPDVESLAGADIEDLNKILYPLGLRWRNPSFGLMAREVQEKYHSKIPDRREDLLSLPGIGEYVAGAVLSIAFGKNEWLVDSNIVRIFKRYFGVTSSKEGRRDKHIIEIAKDYIMGNEPGKAVMGILDLTSLICKPVKPLCYECTLKETCSYFINNYSSDN